MNKNKWLYLAAMTTALLMTATTQADLGSETQITASDGAYGDYFSKSVGIDGDVMIIGAEGDDDNGTSAGSAYIYEYDSGSGVWLEQKLLADDGVAYDLFGRSVAVSGDTAIVGAIGSGATFNATPGYAYIFVRNGTTGVWEQQQKLAASDGAIDDFFGMAVAIDGDKAAVGATGTASYNGAVYMFSRDASTGIWSEEQKVLNSGNSAFDSFGTAIDIDGINMIVGADGDWGSGNYAGSAYLFARDPSASNGEFWTQVQHLTDPDGGHQHKFGTSVALDGDHAIVGGNWYDGEGNATLNEGTALVFSRDPTSGVWDSGQRLTPATASYHYELGYSVAISGNVAVVGGVGAGSAPGSGGAYVFQKLATGDWLELQHISSPHSAGDDEYAWAMASSGDRFLISSWGDGSITRYQGSAFLYTDIPATRITVADSTPPINDQILAFGDVTEFTTSDQTVTITNDGKLNLVLGNVAAIDTVAAPFTIEGDSCSGQTLTPGANCVLDIRFAPLSTGTFSDSLDIPSNDPNTASVTVSLTGTGTAVLVPDITVTDMIAPINDLQLPFGDHGVGSGISYGVTVTNDGTGDLILGSVASLDPLVAPFSVYTPLETCSGATLTPGASCEIWVVYQPTVAGASSDSFDIPSNDSDEPSVTVTVSGNAVGSGTPDIAVTDANAPNNDLAINFGSLTINTQLDQLVTITNNGDADLNVGTLASSNPLTSPYSIVADNCSGVAVSALSSCTFTVRFVPTVVATYNESFDIPSDDPDQPSLTFNLLGSGIAAPAPAIAVTDTESPVNDLAVPFGNLTVSTSAAEFVTISNVGNADLVIGNVAVANPLAAPFSFEIDGCSGQTLATNEFCSLKVIFAPQSAGNFSDSFDIPSNDSNNSSVTFSVSGSGVAAPEPEISISDSVAPADDLQLVFGSVTQGDNADAQITISNDGSTNLNLGTIGGVNGLQAPFSVFDDKCSGVSLLPTESCVVTVRFAPAAAGAFNDSFDVTSNDSDEPSITITVSGTGTALPVPDIDVSNTTLQFGDVTEQNASTQTLTITNNGSGDLTIGTIGGTNGLQAPFTLANDQCSGTVLAASDSCTLQVRFAPTAVGNFTDSVDIPSDDPDQASITVNVAGAGVQVNSNNNDDGDSGGGSLDLWSLLMLMLVGGLSFARRVVNIRA